VDENEIVWAETTDGGLLHQLFGYYPTLHDARVQSLSIDGTTATMDVDYSDEPEEGVRELTVRMKLIWTEVESIDLTTYDTYIEGITFQWIADGLKTVLGQSFGIRGSIVSGGFEAQLEKADPADPLQEEGTLKITYRR